MKPNLTIDILINEAKVFCEAESNLDNPDLFGVTDGKAVGTYIEHKFQNYLMEKYEYERGSSANGIDFPENALNTDIKVTSIKQPQSSCPFRSRDKKYLVLVIIYSYWFTKKLIRIRKKWLL